MATLFQVALSRLSNESLSAMRDDIEVRIMDGMLSNHSAYIKDQQEKLKIVNAEITKRNFTKKYLGGLEG